MTNRETTKAKVQIGKASTEVENQRKGFTKEYFNI